MDIAPVLSVARRNRSAARSSLGPMYVGTPAVPITGGSGPLEMVLRTGALYPVFQPIISMVDANVYAHEALIRGPQGTALHTPDALLRAAADEGLGYEFEYACVIAALRTWGVMRMAGRLFVNISANALTHLHSQHGSGQTRAVRADHDHMVAALHAITLKHMRHLPDHGEQVRPVQRLPNAIFFFAQRRVTRALAGMLLQ